MVCCTKLGTGKNLGVHAATASIGDDSKGDHPAGNGKERSLAEYSVLFDNVGLRTIKTTPLDNGYVVIETAAA